MSRVRAVPSELQSEFLGSTVSFRLMQDDAFDSLGSGMVRWKAVLPPMCVSCLESTARVEGKPSRISYKHFDARGSTQNLHRYVTGTIELEVAVPICRQCSDLGLLKLFRLEGGNEGYGRIWFPNAAYLVEFIAANSLESEGAIAAVNDLRSNSTSEARALAAAARRVGDGQGAHRPSPVHRAPSGTASARLPHEQA